MGIMTWNHHLKHMVRAKCVLGTSIGLAARSSTPCRGIGPEMGSRGRNSRRLGRAPLLLERTKETIKCTVESEVDATMAFTTFYRPVVQPEEQETVNVGIMIGGLLSRWELESRQLPSSPSSSAWVAWPTATAGPRRLGVSLESRGP